MPNLTGKSQDNESGNLLPKVYYPFLDGFRAIAIIMILAHHIRRGFSLDYIFVSNPPILKYIYYRTYQLFGIDLTAFYKGIQYFISQLKGVMGVELFFVISGFLITGILLRKEIHLGNVAHFYGRRFFRIYPAYCLMVLISVGFYVLHGNEQIVDGIVVASYHLLFLQNYFLLHPLLAHTWTLVVLEQFYFYCPLIILTVNLIVPQLSQRRMVLIVLCLFFILIGLMIRVECLKTGHPVITWPLVSTTPYWTISANLGPICFGSLLALLEPYWSKWKKNKWWGVLLWSLGMALFYYLFFCVNWSYYWGKWYMYSLAYLCVGLLFFAAYHGVSLFARLKSFQWLGRQSYGIFVWHYLVLEFWKIWIGTIPPELIVIFCFFSCILVGALSTNTFERYFLNLRADLIPNV